MSSSNNLAFTGSLFTLPLLVLGIVLVAGGAVLRFAAKVARRNA